jgi:hypothetical protein
VLVNQSGRGISETTVANGEEVDAVVPDGDALRVMRAAAAATGIAEERDPLETEATRTGR